VTKRFTWCNQQTTGFELTRDDSGPSRVYRLPDGSVFESVTSFVGKFSTGKADIARWKESIGEVEATKVLKAAGTRGTAIHEACESLLLNQPEQNVSMFYKQDFQTMKKHLIEHVDNIFALEHQMYSRKIGLAGTVDVIAEYDGIMSIIDFKTSSRLKYSDEINSYYLQEAAYALMCQERYGLFCKQLVTLMVVEGDPKIHVFIEPTIKRAKELIKLKETYV